MTKIEAVTGAVVPDDVIVQCGSAGGMARSPRRIPVQRRVRSSSRELSRLKTQLNGKGQFKEKKSDLDACNQGCLAKLSSRWTPYANIMQLRKDSKNTLLGTLSIGR